VIRLDFGTLAERVGGRLLNMSFKNEAFEGVSIDSRTVSPRQLFIAIKGERTDGHKFVADALAKGAAGLMVSEHNFNSANIKIKSPMIVVSDTHHAMINLASGYRRELSTEFIAITGSNGKTTTKEIVYAILASRCKQTYRSPGNLNNLYGLPLAIFAIPHDTKYGVFELGISLPGEMTKLAEALQPDIALITNVSATHLGTLGTVQNVAEAKLELVDIMSPEKPIILNCDDTVLMKAAGKRKRKYITYGIESSADFRAKRIGISEEGFPTIEIDGSPVKIKLFGDHQAYNILAGYALARTLHIDIRPDELNHIDYHFAPYRGEIENINGLTIIADCYNANPVSMKSGLESFYAHLQNPAMKDKRGIAVIGDMLELGENSPEFHREIGKLLTRLNFPIALMIGSLSKDMYDAAIKTGSARDKVKHFDEVSDAGELLLNNVRKGDVIYFKASRGIGLEKIISLLRGSAFRQN